MESDVSSKTANETQQSLTNIAGTEDAGVGIKKDEVTVGMTGNTENIKTTNELSNEKKERNDRPSLERTSSENESMKNGGTTLKTLQANKSPEVDLTKPPR